MILVTGGAGFIGSNLVNELLKKEQNIAILDNFNDFYDPEIKRKNIEPFKDSISLFECDIRDEKALANIFKTCKIDSIIHLAAMAGVRPSIKNPKLYTDVNIRGTQNLLEACKDFEIKNFVLASSSSVYGNNKKVPFCESDSVDFPISPYAATKKSCELICHNYAHLYNINITCLRFFTAYGPAQRPDLAIHKFTKLLYESKPIQMYGDGTSSRDYTYIDDIVEGVVKAYEKLNGYNIYNLGESETIKLIDLITLLSKLTGKDAKIEKLPMQPGDVNKTYADISKARKELSYNPQTKLEAGLKKFVTWFNER